MLRIAAFLFAFLMTVPAYAMEVKQSNALPFKENTFTVTSANNSGELPSVADVTYELNYLGEVLPLLKKESWPVYIVSGECYKSTQQVTGAANKNTMTAALFARNSYANRVIFIMENNKYKAVYMAPYLASHTVSHEVGHLVRFKYVSLEKLREYVRMRGNPQINPEELFAEDFMWLFGSDRARAIGYQHKISPPGDKERDFIRGVLSVKRR